MKDKIIVIADDGTHFIVPDEVDFYDWYIDQLNDVE